MRNRIIPALLMAFSLMLAMPAESQAQSFLKKMKQKAEKAIGKAVGLDMSTDEEEAEKQQQKEDNPLANQPTATEKLPKLKQNTVVWDGEVTPSKAADVHALLNELPALPTAAQIADPNEATVSAYHRKLTALNLRANELDEELACSDEEMLAARDKLYKELENLFGISAEEIKRMDDPNTPAVERARLEKKVKNNLLGGMSEEELANDIQTRTARNEKRLKELQAEAEAFEKKEKAGTLTQADYKRAEEMRMEMMAIQQDLMGGGLGKMMELGQKTNALTAKLTSQNAKFDSQVKAFTNKLTANAKQEQGVVKNCDQIARDYEDELSYLYEQIWKEEDATKVHALYDQADDLMKNYRTRAAKVYLRGLQLRLDNTKKLLPEAEKLYSSMANDGIIPQCAMQRAPLNVVIQCIDILHEAYTEFPQPDVLPCKKSIINIGLKKTDHVHHFESGYGGNIGTGGIGGLGSGGGSAVGDTLALEREFKAKSSFLVYDEKEETYYKVQNGKRNPLPADQKHDFAPKAKRNDAAYGELALRGGNRKLVYSRDGSLTLHDGTTFHPVAMHRTGNWLVFIAWSYKEEQYIRYMYKL